MRVTVIASLFWIAGLAGAAADDPLLGKIPYMSVDGSASVMVKPDTAILSLGVTVERPTAAAAMADAARQASAIVADMKSLGIAPADIQTAALSLSPLYTEERDPPPRTAPKRTLSGYQAATTLTVRVHDVDRSAEIVRHVVEQGANTFNGVRFEISDASARIDAIRATAVTDALKRAALYAQAAGLKPGRVLLINPDGDPAEPAGDMRMKALAPAPMAMSMPIEPGQQALRAHVRVTVELVAQ